jgi:predicted enzyme related to lactoylglutathione lyase
MFTKLRTVIYPVNDLEHAKRWYTEVTGISPYFDQPYYVGFDIHGAELGLDPDPEVLETGNRVISYWKVDSLSGALEKMTALGAEISKPAQEVGGGIQVAVVRDPFGNSLGLIQEP